MPELLKLIPPEDAWIILKKNLPLFQPETEDIPVQHALGRVSADAVIADQPLPGFTRSTVDGYAVKSADTYGARDSSPAYLTVKGEILMGTLPQFSLATAEAAVIPTGGMLPEGADAVVMVEQTQFLPSGEVEIYKAVAPSENVIQMGEDVLPGQVVIPRGTRLRPAEIGGMMALGQTRVRVANRPKVAILSTGDEVIRPELIPNPGQVRDINTFTLSALIEQAGGKAVTYGIFPDRKEVIQEGLHHAFMECQMALITAGSSASARDLTADVIRTQGTPGVLVHGINIRPGKPTILAVCDGKAVIGLPGNPVSALVIAGLFVVPLIEYLLGLQRAIRPELTARLTINLPSQAGREEWLPVGLSTHNGEYQAEPIFFKSNLIFNLVKADGLVHIPADFNGLSAGDSVKVVLI
jgi:molybdopterin molybdotransferase